MAILIEKFLGEFYKETGLYRKVPKNVIDKLSKYDWPGNIRELRNVVERMAVSSEGVNITTGDIPRYILEKSLVSNYKTNQVGLKNIVESVEKDVIIQMLKEAEGNKSRAAKKLNIPRATLYRKMEEYGIDDKQYM